MLACLWCFLFFPYKYASKGWAPGAHKPPRHPGFFNRQREAALPSVRRRKLWGWLTVPDQVRPVYRTKGLWAELSGQMVTEGSIWQLCSWATDHSCPNEKVFLPHWLALNSVKHHMGIIGIGCVGAAFKKTKWDRQGRELSLTGLSRVVQTLECGCQTGTQNPCHWALPLCPAFCGQPRASWNTCLLKEPTLSLFCYPY